MASVTTDQTAVITASASGRDADVHIEPGGAGAVVGSELHAGDSGDRAKRHLHGDADQGGDQCGDGGVVEQPGCVERAGQYDDQHGVLAAGRSPRRRGP